MQWIFSIHIKFNGDYWNTALNEHYIESCCNVKIYNLKYIKDADYSWILSDRGTLRFWFSLNMLYTGWKSTRAISFKSTRKILRRWNVCQINSQISKNDFWRCRPTWSTAEINRGMKGIRVTNEKRRSDTWRAIKKNISFNQFIKAISVPPDRAFIHLIFLFYSGILRWTNESVSSPVLGLIAWNRKEKSRDEKAVFHQ